MKKVRLIMFFCIGVMAFLASSFLHAEQTQPKFDIIPLTATTWIIPTNGTATIQYCITNRTKITRTLTMGPIAGIPQTLGVVGVAPCATPCGNPFTLAHNQSCILTLQIDGSKISETVTQGPVICKTNGPGDNTPDPFLCSQPSKNNSLNITPVGFENALLTVAPTRLNLTADPSNIGGSCAIPGTLTVTNNSTTVTAVGITNTTPLPPNWSASNVTLVVSPGCASLAPGSSACTLTFTPGNQAFSPLTFDIQGSNTTQTSADVHIEDGLANISVNPAAPMALELKIFGSPGILTVTNHSSCITASDVNINLSGALANAGVTVSPIPPTCPSISHGGGTCIMTITPGGTTVIPAVSAAIAGTNTNTAEAKIEVQNVASGIAISPALLMLTSSGSTESFTITNTSSTIPALNVTATLSATLIGTGVTQTANTCTPSLAPSNHCFISFQSQAPGSIVIPTTPNVSFQGTNTGAAIDATISVTDAQLTISPQSVILAKNLSFTAAAGCNTTTNSCTAGATSTPRTITITNSNASPALNVMFNFLPSLPQGTTTNPTQASGCGNIVMGTPCVITITPGQTPSTPAPAAPQPSIMTISGTNVATISNAASVTVLEYGNQYQGGYVYSMDDSLVSSPYHRVSAA